MECARCRWQEHEQPWTIINWSITRQKHSRRCDDAQHMKIPRPNNHGFQMWPSEVGIMEFSWHSWHFIETSWHWMHLRWSNFWRQIQNPRWKGRGLTKAETGRDVFLLTERSNSCLHCCSAALTTFLASLGGFILLCCYFALARINYRRLYSAFGRRIPTLCLSCVWIVDGESKKNEMNELKAWLLRQCCRIRVSICFLRSFVMDSWEKVSITFHPCGFWPNLSVNPPCSPCRLCKAFRKI